MQPKLKVKTGDTVEIRAGRDKGRRGEVLRVIPSRQRVIVGGVNVVRRHEKPSMQTTGGIQEKELSIHISNVALIDPKTDQPTRAGYRMESGIKVRYAKRSGEAIE